MNDRRINEALLLRHVRGESNDEEKMLVECWLAEDNENKKILKEIASIYLIHRTGTKISKRNALESYEKFIINLSRRKFLKVIKYSAPVAATILIFVLFNFFRRQPVFAPIVEQKIIIHTNPGMRTTLDLPDGTLVNLNSSSTLAYIIPFEENNRTIYLEGEAYFDVFSDKQRPFVVNLKDSSKQVIATGTEFNIQAYPRENLINTILVEGTIEFISKEPDGRENKQHISPSERIIYNNKSGTIFIDSVNTEYYTSWKEGKLIFCEAPLMDVLYRLSHYYDVKFEIANRELITYSFTGTFENRQLNQVLEYLNISSGIEYELEQTTEDDNNGIKRNKVILK